MAARTDSLQDAFGASRRQLQISKKNAADSSATLAADNVSSNAIKSIMGNLKGAIETWTTAINASGINNYARTQHDTPGYNFVNETQAVVDAAVIARDECISLLGGVGNYIQIEKPTADGGLDVDPMTPTQTGTLQANLTTLAGTIG